MRKIFIVMAAILFFLAAIPSQVASSTPSIRFATCDACGYCPLVDNTVPTCTKDTRSLADGGNPVPGNWAACGRCLYPSIFPQSGPAPDPNDCSTVTVIGDRAPTPMPGRQYTMIGCLTTQGDVFQNTAATGASSFTQAILDLLVFRVVGGIAFLYLMYGAFIMMTSQSDPEKLNYGRRVIIGAIAGLLFALGSVFLVNLIGSGILKIPGFSGSQ